MKRKIVWDKWSSPFSENEYGPEGEEKSISVRPVVASAVGLVPITIYGKLTDNFDFWVGHSNFNISKQMIGEIERVPGVETLDIATRYRFRVGVGKAFNNEVVRENIGILLGVMPEPSYKFDEKTRNKIEAIKEVAQKYENWAIYVLPNGQIEFIHDSNARLFEEKLEVVETTQALAGGMIIGDNP